MMERRYRFGAKRAGEREGEGQRLPLAIKKGGRLGCAKEVHPGRPLPLLLGYRALLGGTLRERAKRASGAERSGAETSSIGGHNFSARRMYLILILSEYFSFLACACGRCFITYLSIFNCRRYNNESTFFSIFADI